jgi:alpha-1,3-rhamnosyl/mannosyltransferase
LKALRADVFFSFHNLSGPGLRTCPTVLSILDTIPLTEPQFYFDSDSRLRRFIVLLTMRRACAAADRAVATSEFTRRSAIAVTGLRPEQITTLHLQADDRFFEPCTEAVLAATRAKYGLPEHFILTMGASEPRKNVATLVKAHRELPEQVRRRFPLMIAGKKWHGREVDLSGDPQVRLLGYVDDEDLPSLYRSARLFVFPSRYEGFGIPVLEAMSSDTPVISTTATSIPEVAGDAAILLDPDDVRGFTASMLRLLSDEAERQRLVTAGRRQVAGFSWERTALTLLRILGDAARRPRARTGSAPLPGSP